MAAATNASGVKSKDIYLSRAHLAGILELAAAAIIAIDQNQQISPIRSSASFLWPTTFNSAPNNRPKSPRPSSLPRPGMASAPVNPGMSIPNLIARLGQSKPVIKTFKNGGHNL